jgi:hypothetical protein
VVGGGDLTKRVREVGSVGRSARLALRARTQGFEQAGMDGAVFARPCSRCLCPDGRTIRHDVEHRSRTLAPRNLIPVTNVIEDSGNRNRVFFMMNLCNGLILNLMRRLCSRAKFVLPQNIREMIQLSEIYQTKSL